MRARISATIPANGVSSILRAQKLLQNCFRISTERAVFKELKRQRTSKIAGY